MGQLVGVIGLGLAGLGVFFFIQARSAFHEGTGATVLVAGCVLIGAAMVVEAIRELPARQLASKAANEPKAPTDPGWEKVD